MAKFVIYKENGNYKFTTSENYFSRISNARRIATYRPENGFTDARTVLEYILRTSPGLDRSDIDVLVDEKVEDLTDTRFDGVVDQIDALLWMQHDNGSLSDEQLKQLAELKYQVASYGERGQKWAQECDRAIANNPVKLESMMDFYAKFVNAFDCPPVLAEAALGMFKEVLLETSQSSSAADRLRQKVGTNPNETDGVGVFGVSGDDNLPPQSTIDKEISDAMVSGSFDALGEDITTTDPNGFDEMAMGLGSSELDDSDNDLNPDDWAAEEPAPEEDVEENELSEDADVTDGTEGTKDKQVDSALDDTGDEEELDALGL